VTVNCLAPGWFKTAQNAVMYENADWVAYLSAKIPLRRPGAIDDLTGALLFLSSDASAYITGQTLLIDGGVSVNDTRALPRPAP
jgi:gluconate 5-dehydrogenase